MSDDPALTALRKCGNIARHGGGDRFSHDYCDALPNGHEGPCEDRPSAQRMAEAWAKVWTSPAVPTPEGAEPKEGNRRCISDGCKRDALPDKDKCCIACVPEPRDVHLAWCQHRNPHFPPNHPWAGDDLGHNCAICPDESVWRCDPPKHPVAVVPTEAPATTGEAP